MGAIDANSFTGMIDLSKWEDQEIDWNAAKQAGIIAVVHKATEGLTVQDPLYRHRRSEAKGAGLLWGSYHFSGLATSPGRDQADAYLEYAEPDIDEFICFDCEKHGTFVNMENFVARIHEQTGRYPAIYGRRLLRKLMKGNGGSIVNRGILWYDEYPKVAFSTPQEALPEGWQDWTLWQYTDGKFGPEPRATPGVGKVDRNTFKGTADQFKARWPFAVT